jgi:uncharacterized domain HDIG
MIAHCLSSEAVMRRLAVHFNENEELWGLAGLLHDLDVEETEGNHELHGNLAADFLRENGFPQVAVDAIRRHNERATSEPRTTLLDHALAAGETITGLITATAMVYPDKKVASVKPSSVVKRMKEKNFAASVKRENIMECEEIGISIASFAEMAIEAMRGVADQIGL